MILADAHCHLNHELYKNELDALLERSKEAGVKAIICSGVNVPTNREALALARKYAPLVRCSLGIYPVDALGLPADETGLARQVHPIDMDAELEFIKQNKENIAGIGEAGLDFHWVKDKQLREKEKENFAKIIKLAEDIKKPLIVHTRDAETECVEMLESSSVKTVILHCFTGRKHIIKKAIDKGYFFSIPAIIQKLQHFKMVAEMASINQLLSETDGPWLSPIPGKPNEPANVLYVIRNIAQVKNFTEEEVANNLWLNFQRVFG
ncbi:Tat-linked quality control protein TatD [uncultured archaeon]|nr:Tat-linked quality control protein TatD [uncultured archaeon]